MDIKILGGGCANCRALEAMAKDAIAQLGITATVEEVTDYAAIASYGVMRTPALVIDGTVFLSGRVPQKDEVRRIIEGLGR
ncbi:MAG: thioredoxin family protein [Acidimicrobiia bacterium]|jgi:small redox-active disulfide protein 2|nr:thioredoxin family protein [Acidimicrobiia bacterium]